MPEELSLCPAIWTTGQSSRLLEQSIGNRLSGNTGRRPNAVRQRLLMLVAGAVLNLRASQDRPTTLKTTPGHCLTG